jgi:hypothetical protein
VQLESVDAQERQAEQLKLWLGGFAQNQAAVALLPRHLVERACESEAHADTKKKGTNSDHGQ